MGFPGNGIHVTNKRLILARTKLRMFGGMLGTFGGSIGGGVRSGKLSGKASEQKIRELPRRRCSWTSSVMLSYPSKREVQPEEWRPEGRAEVGRADHVAITAMRDFEIMKELMTAFYPESRNRGLDFGVDGRSICSYCE